MGEEAGNVGRWGSLIMGEEVASLDKRLFQKLKIKVHIPCSFT